MTTPALPTLAEVQAFFQRFVENQKQIHEKFTQAVKNKSAQKLQAADPSKQSKLEESQKKYHQKLQLCCDNLKKQSDVGQKLFEDSKNIKKEASPETIQLLTDFQAQMTSLQKDWEKVQGEIAPLEQEIIGLLPKETKVK